MAKMQEHKITYTNKDGTIVTKSYFYPYVSKKKERIERSRKVDRLTDGLKTALIEYYEKGFPTLKGTLVVSEEYNCILSSKGRAFSFSTKIGEIGINPSNHGYCSISSIPLHIAIYKTFSTIPYDPLLDIDHIDGNRSNNDISNLRQLTHKENINAAIKARGGKHWRSGIEASGDKSILSKPVLQVDKVTKKLIKEWESQNLAATTLGIH